MNLHQLLTALRAIVAAYHPDDAERGDVPGWVLVTLMTVGIVMALWAIAEPQLSHLLNGALSVTGDPNK